jgi:hypothetical protein
VIVLSAKQEVFAQAVAMGNTQADAYRAMLPNSVATDKTIHEKASAVAKIGKVSARIEELRTARLAKVPQELAYEHIDAMKELDDAIAFAKGNNHSAAVVAALNLKQKISGLHVEDRKNDRSAVSGMGFDEMSAALNALQAIKNAKVGA